MHKMLVVLLSALSGAAFAGNYAECLLDKLPGSENETFTSAAANACAQEYPGLFYTIKKGDGQGIFGFSDRNSCVLKKSKDTKNQRAATLIYWACECLYEAPFPGNEMCAYRPVTKSNPYFDPNTATVIP